MKIAAAAANLPAELVFFASCCFLCFITLIHAGFSPHHNSVLYRRQQQHHPHHAPNNRNLRLFQSTTSTLSSSLTNEKSPREGDDSGSLTSSSSSSSSSPFCNARLIAAKALLPSGSRNMHKKGTGGAAEFAVERLEADYTFNHQLSSRDKGFARLIVSTVERRMGQIDMILHHCSVDTKKRKSNNSSSSSNNNNNNNKKPQQRSSLANKPKKSRVDEYVEAVLRVGAVQLLFLDTSPHAAVKETVDLLRIQQQQSDDDTADDPASSSSSSSSTSSSNMKSSAAAAVVVPKSRIGYVNAVLRRISREGPELLAMTSVLDNVAPWLLKEWNDAWSKDATLGIVQAAMRESPRCLSIRRGDGEEYDDETVQLQKSIQNVAAQFPNDCEILPQGSIRIHTLPLAGSIANWPLYTSGAWWLQDVSSTLPAIALYKALTNRQKDAGCSVADLTVVDLCAAPGGKTAQLCNFGFGHVIAVEKSLRRSKRLEKNLDRLRFRGNTTTSSTTATSIHDGKDCSTPLRQKQQRHHYSLVVADGTKYKPDTRVAGVLLDAPCTATGTASKRPDVLRRSDDFTDLLDTQYRLACHAADHMLSVGGILVYATCSLLKQEGEEQVQRLLARRSRDNDALDSAATATEVAVLETVPFVPGEIPGFDAAITANGWLRILPTSSSSGKDENGNEEKSTWAARTSSGLFDHVDGFFVARLRRVR
jgi:16S rRNA (cytosine967-C5)-methyltransferase